MSAIEKLYWAIAYLRTIPEMLVLLVFDFLMKCQCTRNPLLKKLEEFSSAPAELSKDKTFCTVSWKIP